MGAGEWCLRDLRGVQQGLSAGVFVPKEASSGNKIQKPVNLRHNDSGVSRPPHLSDWNNPAVCRWINELLRLICKSNNETRHCACVWECVWTPGRVSLGVWEPPKVGTGQPPHPCPVFLPEQRKKNESWGGCEQDAATANNARTDMGSWRRGGKGRGKNTTVGVGGHCGNKPPQSNSVIRIQHADT